MRILLTGSSGQLGTAIAEQLAARHEIVGIDLVPGKWTRRLVSITQQKMMKQLAREVDAIIHTASLHQPHIAKFSEQDFIETNVTGTFHLLEAAAQSGIQRFVYTSTTSLYGRAMVSPQKAVWVTEQLEPLPRDIYDNTKITAEKLCQQFAIYRQLPTICLRIARCFPEPPHLLALYRLYRGVDIRDAAAAHVLAVSNQAIDFGIFNIAARSPFRESDLTGLRKEAAQVLQKRAPTLLQTFAQHSWGIPDSIDRVYVIEKAEQYLGYHPVYNFGEYLQELNARIP